MMYRPSSYYIYRSLSFLHAHAHARKRSLTCRQRTLSNERNPIVVKITNLVIASTLPRVLSCYSSSSSEMRQTRRTDFVVDSSVLPSFLFNSFVTKGYCAYETVTYLNKHEQSKILHCCIRTIFASICCYHNDENKIAARQACLIAIRCDKMTSLRASCRSVLHSTVCI